MTHTSMEPDGGDPCRESPGLPAQQTGKPHLGRLAGGVVHDDGGLPVLTSPLMPRLEGVLVAFFGNVGIAFAGAGDLLQRRWPAREGADRAQCARLAGPRLADERDAKLRTHVGDPLPALLHLQQLQDCPIGLYVHTIVACALPWMPPDRSGSGGCSAWVRSAGTASALDKAM